MAKVLLVEDDNNLREIYQARLMAEGYDIVAAQNGEEALVVAKQNKPDLIISDVMMPRISGFEMLDILRNTEGLKHTPVIMLTALGQSEDQKRADNLGADKYLVKSQVTLEDIVAAAKGLLDKDGLTGVTAVPPAPEAAAPAAPAEPVKTTSGAIPVAEPPADPAATVTNPSPVAPEPAPAPTAAVPQTQAVPAPVPAPVAVAPIPEPAAPAPVALPEPTITAVPPAPEAAAPAAPVTPSAPTVAPIAQPLVEEEPASESTPEVPTPDTQTAIAAVTDAATQSLEAEEAALQAQIANYAKEPGEDPPAVDPAQAAAAAAASNDEALNEAVEELSDTSVDTHPAEPPSVANAPEPVVPTTPEPTTPAPAPATAPAVVVSPTSDNVNVAGKKIIQPLSDPATKPNLDALLAKEAAAAPPAPATPVIDGSKAQAPVAPPPPAGQTPGQTIDPNTVAL
jgi:CheY-like chemotaxis protein